MQVTDMYFHNETTNDTLSDGLIGIYKLMIDGELVDTAHSLNGELAFNLGRVPQGIIGGDSDIEVELVADFDDVDDDVKT